MDVFGHAALSVLVGRGAAPRPELRTATTLGALAGGLLPDLDAVVYLWGADAFRQHHQLWTHNLFALVLLPAVAGALLGLILRRDRAWILAGAWLGMAFHLAGDVIGLWPVPLLHPVADVRVAFYLLEQDFSPALDAVLVLGAVASFWDPVAERPGRVRITALMTLAAAVVAIALT